MEEKKRKRRNQYGDKIDRGMSSYVAEHEERCGPHTRRHSEPNVKFTPCSLIRLLKQKLDSKEDTFEFVSMWKKVMELEFLLSNEKEQVLKLDNTILKEKAVMEILEKRNGCFHAGSFEFKVNPFVYYGGFF